MYQVTVVWNDCEIGYGEGESLQYATQEAKESVEKIYAAVRREWQLEVKKS